MKGFDDIFHRRKERVIKFLYAQQEIGQKRLTASIISGSIGVDYPKVKEILDYLEARDLPPKVRAEKIGKGIYYELIL